MNWIRSKSIIFWIIGVVTLIALSGLVSVTTPAPAGSAQQAQGGEVPEFSTYTLFTYPHSLTLKPDELQKLADAIRKAQAPGKCRLGRLKLRVAEGNRLSPLFKQGTLDDRRDAVVGALESLHHVPVVGRLLVETLISGGNEGADARYEPARDKKSPIISADSDPKKGEPVKANSKITVTIKARDGDGEWETGIKTIKLVADSEGGRVIASKNFEPCAEPKEHVMAPLIYNVPPNLPPIVRLRAVAEDHAGNSTSQVAEFPVPGERTHYYSVQVKASVESVMSCSPCYSIRKDPIGTETSRVVWTGTWPRVPMTVVTQESGEVGTWITSYPVVGMIEATFSYDNTFASSKCSGQITVSGPAPALTLEGSRPASGEGKSHVKFGGRAEPSVWGTQRVCDKVLWGGVSGSFGDMTTPLGVLLEADNGASTYVGFSRDGSGSFFPLDELLTGKGFTVNGHHTGKGSGYGDGSTETWTGSASVVITPVQ